MYLPSPSEEEYYNYRFPEKVLLSISTHGEYMLDKKCKSTSSSSCTLEKFVFKEKIPDSKIILITATPIGVSNYREKEMSELINTKLLENFHHYNSSHHGENITKKTVIEKIFPFFLKKVKSSSFSSPSTSFVQSIVPTLRFYDEKMNEEILKDRHLDSDYYEYFAGYDRSYNVQIKKTNDIILDKYFFASKSEKESSTEDFNIKILNISENNDLYQIFQGTHRKEYSVNLSEIIDFLNSHGAKTIIIFDFTCSSILGTSEYIKSPRTLRKIRRQEGIHAMNATFNKKRKRKSSSSSNTRKNKKK